ncbi:MAG: 50S ribosomal protein L6 [Candidatus Margulisbacteria bacterium]|nr:50S ribosomal protein L6 [Candidatus Margulisiibacteriota bacterium]
MARLGKRPIKLENDVTVSIDGQKISVKGPKGTLQVQIGDQFEIKQDEGALTVIPRSSSKELSPDHGLYRTLLLNAIEGVSKGYQKDLELVGVGYRVQKKGNGLSFTLGYSHPVVVPETEGISFNVSGQNKISIVGIDKQKVGQVTANIRRLRKLDKYKGKGILFAGQRVKLKAGKSVK